jgi:PAS domain S-box-containing protein
LPQRRKDCYVVGAEEKKVSKDVDFVAQLNALCYDPFFVIDRDRRVTYGNDVFSMTLGVRVGQRHPIEGRLLRELLAFDETGESCITDCLRTDANIRVESAKAKLADGRILTLDMSALPLRNDQGQVTGLIVMLRDVTDEQRLRDRYMQERNEHLSDRESLLRIIRDRDEELKKLKKLSGQ